jgi:hypothetical protein
LWEWYVKPAKIRGEQARKEMERAQRGGDVFAPETPEEIEMAMQMLRVLFPQSEPKKEG